MYVHAYQSYVWNVVASARLRMSSSSILVGDLVLVNPENGVSDELDLDDPDAGTEFHLPESENKDNLAVKVLTEADIESGQYSIYDIVLPTPGYDVIYPTHPDLRQAYIDTMAPDSLDPFDMRRVVREVSMVGHYRRVVHQPEDVSWDIIRYNGRDTLLDTKDHPKEGEFMAVRVQLRLGTSQYATMALREICKRDSIHIQYWGKERDEQEKAKQAVPET
jgi:tRNA pseudouridine13 synthase